MRRVWLDASVVVLTALMCADAEARSLYDRSVEHQLQSSGIPVMLPSRMPAQIGLIASVVVITADRSGYYVGYSADPRCQGGLACASVHVAGYRRSSIAGRTFRNARRVALPDRSNGFYTPRDCSGSSCVEASLTFARSRAIYEIDVKGARALPLLLEVYRRLRPLDGQLQYYCGR